MLLRCSVFLTGLVFALSAATNGLAYYVDAPHNESNGIVCSDCHVNEAYDNHVPNNIDDTINNVICLGCHGPGGPAPQHKLHSDLIINGTETWTTQCTDCHDPHFQDNVRSWAGIDSNTFLATGTVTATTYTTTAPVAEHPDGTTTISYIYNDLSFTDSPAPPDWSDPSTWNSKGVHSDINSSADISRGLIFMINYENLGDTFEIIDATNSTITLKGQLPPSPGLNFAILYGQSIRSYMLDANGNGEKYIKSFTPLNSSGTDKGFVDSTSSQTPFGICQVCHPKTVLYWNNDNSGNGPIVHSPDEPCSACHLHSVGFAPGADHANFLTGGTNCINCHASFTNPETAHPSCYSCHPVTSVKINYLQVRAELPTVTNHVALAGSADHTFDANDRLIDGSGRNVKDPLFTKVTCVICHANKDLNWDDPNNHETNTHPVAVIATTDNSCETCHVVTTGPFNTTNEVHFNGGTPASCDLCHNPSDGTLTSLAVNHSIGTQSNCKTCHEVGIAKHVPPPSHPSDQDYEGGQNGIPEPLTGSCIASACHGASPDILNDHMGLQTVTFPLGMDCLSCHTPGSKLDDNAVADAIDAGKSTAVPSAVAPACADCHGAQTEPHGFVDHVLPASANYPPITVNSECIACHPAYIAPGTAHVTSCATCHLQVPTLRTTPNLAQFAGRTVNCTDCHQTSNDAGFFNPFHGVTSATVGGLHDLPSASCQSCHSNMTTGETQLIAHMGSGNDCAICHDADDTVNGTSATSLIFIATTPIDPTTGLYIRRDAPVSCEQCHAFKGDYRLHGMTVFDTHDAHNSTTFEDTPSSEPAAIKGNCATCHTAFASPNLAMNHISLSTTTTYAFGMNCQSCHNYSGSKLSAAGIAAVINSGVTSNGGIPASCADCHNVRIDPHPDTPPNDHLDDASKGYKPITPDSECTICHSDTITQMHQYDCTSCHTASVPDLISTPFDLTQFVFPTGSPTSCTDCHDSVTFPTIKNHGLAAADVGTKHNMFSTTCIPCHDSMPDGETQLNEHMVTGDCQICHGAANTANGTSATDAIIAATAPTENLVVICEQCHALKGDYKLHGLDSASSSDIHNNTAFDTTPALTCNTADCHGDMASVASGHLALPATTAYSDGMDCDSCHNYNPVVESVVLGVIVNTLVGTLDPNDIDVAINNGKSSAGNSLATAFCADCHNGVRPADHPNVDHTAEGSGGYIPITSNAGCINCHNTDIVDVHPTCETCHTASMTELITTPFNLAQFAGTTTSCTDCHNNSNVPTIREHGITAASVGSIHNISSSNCQTCHDNMTTGVAQLNRHMIINGCVDCHTANTGSATTVIDTATAPTVNLSVTCEQCHTLKGNYKLHGLTVADTTDVHNNTVLEDSPSQELASLRGTCSNCHSTFNNPNLVVSHFAMSSTPTYGSGMNCLSCHNYTQGAVAGMTQAQVDTAIDEGVASNPSPKNASCADCHDAQTLPHPATPDNDHLDPASKGYAPITADIECVTCHTGSISHLHSYNCSACHYSIMPYLTTVPFDLTQFAGSTTRCTDCHNTATFPTIKEHGLTAVEVGSRHNLSSANCLTCHDTMTTGVAQLNIHIGVDECDKCHTANDSGSASAKTVITNAIAPTNNLSVTCEECHVVKGNYLMHGLTGADTTDVHNNTHDLATTPATEVNNPTLNCANCHGDFAASDLHTVHISLTSTTTYSTGMDCLSCHAYSQGAKLPNMTKANVDAAITAGATDQPPVVDCADCHSPLAADHGGHPVPDTFVGERTECTVCHDSQNNRDYITDIHNRRAASKGIPNNCEVCHNSANYALQDYSGGGAVLIPGDLVNYAARTGGTGGDCLTCHNDSGGGSNMPFSQTDNFANLIKGQTGGPTFGNWTEITDVNGATQWMIWKFATDSSGTGPSSGTGKYVVLESSPATAACTVDPNGTYIEAENYENSIIPGVYNWSTNTTVNGANNGQYLRTTNGGTSTSTQGARADYTVVIPAAGTYQISMRLHDADWPGGGGDSTMWGVNGNLVGIITETTVGTWTWTSNEHALSNRYTFPSAGTYTINLWPRERDQLTDAFILWNISNSAPVSERNTTTSIPNGITVLDPTNCGSSGDVDATNGSDLLAAGTSQYLESNTFDWTLYDSLSISFDYNMNVSDNIDAVLSVAGWDGTTWRPSTVVQTGSTGDNWQGSGTIDFIGYTNADFKIRIHYLVGSGTLYQNDVAIDNVVISGALKTVGDGSRYHPSFIHNTISDGTGNCTTTCHTESNSITGTHKVSGGVNSPDCGKCHYNNTAAVIAAIYDGSDNNTPQTCDVCHNGYTSDFTNSHTVIGDTHATMVITEPTCSTAFCHPGDVKLQVHNDTCDLCHVFVGANNGTLKGTALNHAVGTPSTCSECHINRDSDHTAEHDTALYEDSPTQEDDGAQNTVSGQCDSCHSFMGFNGSGYANISTAHVGLVIDTKDITTGENNEDTGGVITCATCHLSAKTEIVNAIADGRSSATPPANASCADCHGVRTLPHGGHDYTHFSNVSNCNSCHTGSNIIADTHGNQCLLCHNNPLGGDDTTIIEGDPANGIDGDAREASTLGDWRNATCLTCHDGVANTTTTLDAHHGDSKNNYYANEQCALCHDSGATDHNNADFEDSPSQEDSSIGPCVDCHAIFSNLSSGHVGRSVMTGNLGIPVGTEITCTSCHEDATGPVPSVISSSAGSTPSNVPASCADCHGVRPTPHGGHADTDFRYSSVCTSCHTENTLGITLDFHVCADCHVGGNGAVKDGDSNQGDARRGAALADYRNASCLTCHGPDLTTTTIEGAGGSNSATTYGGAHHNNFNAQNGTCDYCHDDPRGNPGVNWVNVFGINSSLVPSPLPKRLACIECHVNESNGLRIYEVDYVWAGTAERTKINSISNVQTVHRIDHLSGGSIQVNNYGICLGCHNEAQKGRPINVYHARPVATNMWATGSDGEREGSTQIDKLRNAAGFNTFKILGDNSRYPANVGGIGDLEGRYGEIYDPDEDLADYVKARRPGSPNATYRNHVRIPCGSI